MLNLAQTVATKVTSTVQNLGEEVLGLFTMSDKKIMDLIYATHVHSDDKFDEDALFGIVENILKRATQTVDKVVQVLSINSLIFITLFIVAKYNICLEQRRRRNIVAFSMLYTFGCIDLL